MRNAMSPFDDDAMQRIDEISHNLEEKGFSERSVEAVRAFWENEDEIPYGLILSLLEHLDRAQDDGAVLIFLPGWGEITRLHELLEDTVAARSGAWQLHPLHGSLPTAQQRLIFRRPPEGVRKVVIATNIAESR